MANQVDMGYRHSGNAFGDHARYCRVCARGGRCATRVAMLRDFERQERDTRREAPTVEIPPLTMEQLIEGGR